MAEVVPHIKSPPDSPAEDHQKALFNKLWSDPKHRKTAKEMHRQATATLQAQLRSGAGYEADKVLRQFLLEYNSRWWTQGRNSLPSSYEVCAAFFNTRREFAGLFLLPERDYLFSFTDFLDFATGADTPASSVERAYALDDKVIYNINSLDKPDTLLLETDTCSSFAFAAANMVRKGDELTMLLVLGEQRPLEDTSGLLENLVWVQMNPNKPHLKSVDPTDNKPMRLTDSDLFRTLALVRFNLKERRVESRQLMYELTNSFVVISDNELMFPRSTDDSPGRAASAVAKLDALNSVWEIAKTLVLLPSYLLARIDVARTEDHATQLGTELRTSMKAKRAMEYATSDSRVLHRRISAIRIVHSSPLRLEGRSYYAPAFQVPVGGFWRSFADTARQGHDENGEVVIGRTWVRAHIRHKDKEAPTEPKVVYIKASLSLARQRLERFRKGVAPVTRNPPVVHRDTTIVPKADATFALPGPSELQQSAAPATAGAYLYVMRCPAHGRDIFKVGFTDRDPEIRARELSSATASPTHFLVVQAWAVSEGKSAESAAHKTLERFRLAGNREFFQATYAELRKEIETAISPWSLG
jgi:hypothetical protein